MNIKAIAAAAVLSTAAIFAPAPAEAMSCFDFEGGTLCNTNVGRSPFGGAAREYYVGWSDGSRTEAMEVHCDGRNMLYWESTGPLTERQARYLATEFCALPNG